MAFCRLLFPILVLSVVQAYASVPVFIWGDLERTSLKSNPLSKVTEAEFDDILDGALKNEPYVVCFIDESLSVEDFSLRNGDDEIAFPYLSANIGHALYLPSVQNPLRGLNGLADPSTVDHVKLTENGLSAEIEPDSSNVLFISLKDARVGESRADLLRRHNDFMEDMFNKLHQRYDKVVAIYTAHFPSWIVPDHHSRVRRQTNQSTNDYQLSGLRLYVKKLELADGGTVTSLDNLASTSAELNGTELLTTMSFGPNVLTLTFRQNSGYWAFESVRVVQTSPSNYDVTLTPTTEVYALMGFSYRCGHNVTFSANNSTHSLLFQDLKVQPFFDNSTSHTFGDSFNCSGFFSAPIWAGLFVTFILLAITFYGIMMMMDIRTMDRFDDPKGKTITINAGE